MAVLTTDGFLEARWRVFTPASISPRQCMARVWNSGRGGQCSSAPADGGAGLCESHSRQARSDKGLGHGRVDGPIPAKKLREFEELMHRTGGNSYGPVDARPSPKIGKPTGSGEHSSEASVAAAQAAARTLQELRVQGAARLLNGMIEPDDPDDEGDKASNVITHLANDNQHCRLPDASLDTPECCVPKGPPQVLAPAPPVMPSKPPTAAEPQEKTVWLGDTPSATQLEPAQPQVLQQKSSSQPQRAEYKLNFPDARQPEHAQLKTAPGDAVAEGNVQGRPLGSMRRCAARIWDAGRGTQCTSGTSDPSCAFCTMHQKQAQQSGNGQPTHGRIDGPIPEKKLREFEAHASRTSTPVPVPGELVEWLEKAADSRIKHRKAPKVSQPMPAPVASKLCGKPLRRQTGKAPQQTWANDQVTGQGSDTAVDSSLSLVADNNNTSLNKQVANAAGSTGQQLQSRVDSDSGILQDGTCTRRSPVKRGRPTHKVCESPLYSSGSVRLKRSRHDKDAGVE